MNLVINLIFAAIMGGICSVVLVLFLLKLKQRGAPHRALKALKNQDYEYIMGNKRVTLEWKGDDLVGVKETSLIKKKEKQKNVSKRKSKKS